MCNCLKTSEEKVTAHLVKANDLKNVTESGYVNVVFTFAQNMPRKLVFPFEVTHIPVKKDGTNGKEKKLKTSIFPAFCPFCGVKYPTEE